MNACPAASRWLPLVTIVCTALIAPGCGEKTASPGFVKAGPSTGIPVTEQPAAQPADDPFHFLPPPSALLAEPDTPRRASYVEADLIKAGEDYDPLLPNNRVSAGSGVSFDPAWSGPPDTSELLAYCMYAFDIPGYDRNAQVRYTWLTPPSDIHEAWIGLADWGPDCWKWYPVNANGKTNLSSLSPHIAFGGGLLLCMVVYGVDNSTLSDVRIGTLLPTAAISPLRAGGMLPKTVSFDASGSSDPDGTIVKFEWDFDGDGTFEESSGLSPEIEHTYTTSGIYIPKVRVRDDDGMMASASAEVGVAQEFAHTWGPTAEDEVCYGIDSDSAGSIYLAGWTVTADHSYEAQLCKFDATGQPVWTRTFSGPNREQFNDVICGPDGKVYVCGYTGSYGYTTFGGVNALLQCWDTDGNLVWSKTWSGEDDEEFNSIAISSGDIFVAGSTNSFGPDKDALVARFDAEGGIIWCKRFGSGNTENLNAIARSKTLLGDPILHVVGHTEVVPFVDLDLIYCKLTEDGTFLYQKTFGNDTGAQVGYAIAPATGLGSTTVIAGTDSSGIGTRDMLIICPTGSWARTWNGGQEDDALSVLRLPDGNYLVGGYERTQTQGWADAALLTITPEGLGAGLEVRDAQGQHDNAQTLASYPGGILVGGFAADAGATWDTQALALGGHDGAWHNASWTLLDASGTLEETPQNLIDVTDGVLDGGAGGSDMLIELREP